MQMNRQFRQQCVHAEWPRVPSSQQETILPATQWSGPSGECRLESGTANGLRSACIGLAVRIRDEPRRRARRGGKTVAPTGHRRLQAGVVQRWQGDVVERVKANRHPCRGQRSDIGPLQDAGLRHVSAELGDATAHLGALLAR